MLASEILRYTDWRADGNHAGRAAAAGRHMRRIETSMMRIDPLA